MNKKQIKLLKTVEINLHYAHEAMRELNKDIFCDEGQEYPVPPTEAEAKTPFAYSDPETAEYLQEHGYPDDTVELDDEALANYVEDQVELGRHPSECLRIWIHTHPGTGIEPSGTDWDMFKSKFTDCDWSLMAIMGSDGETSGGHLWVTYPETGFITLPKIEIDWSVSLEEADPSDWQKELDEKVSSPAPVKITSSPNPNNLYKTPSYYSQYKWQTNIEELDEEKDDDKPAAHSIEEEDCFGSTDDGWDYRSYYG